MRFFEKIKKINIRSIFYNFYLFPFWQACKLPLLIANNTKIKSLPKDSIKLEKVFSGMLQIGYNFIGTLDVSRDRSVLHVTKGGKIYVSGRTQLGTGVNISIGSKGMLIFGENISVSGKSSIICEKKIEIDNM